MKKEIAKLDEAIRERQSTSILNQRKVQQQMSKNWNPERKKACDVMFDVFDADDGGDIDIDEFFFMTKSFDPTLERGQVTDTFMRVGAKDEGLGLALQRPQFYVWVDEVFGELDNKTFVKVVAEMTADAGDLEPCRKVWADRVFKHCDTDAGGFLDLEEFTVMVLAVAPETSPLDIAVTMESSGVDMELAYMYPHHFYLWCHQVFEEVEPYEFEQAMVAIMKNVQPPSD